MKIKGFTLIELIVTIIILGVLSVTAVPKFLNLQNEARTAVIKGVASAVVGGFEIVHAKALLHAKELKENEIEHNGVTIPLHHGYPTTERSKYGNTASKQIGNFIKITKKWVNIKFGDSLDFSVNFVNDRKVKLTLNNSSDPSQCYLTYRKATKNEPPIVDTITDGC